MNKPGVYPSKRISNYVAQRLNIRDRSLWIFDNQYYKSHSMVKLQVILMTVSPQIVFKMVYIEENQMLLLFIFMMLKVCLLVMLLDEKVDLCDIWIKK